MDRGPQYSNPKSIWWRDVYRHWPVYAAGLVAMLITNGSEVLAPKTLQWMVDSLFAASKVTDAQAAQTAFGAILRSAVFFILVAIAGLLGRIFWRFTLARMTHFAGATMKRSIWDALRSSSLESVHRFTLGDLMNRAIGDVNSARWIYGFTLVLTCDVVFFTSLGAISMFLIHPGLAFACLSTFVIFPPIVLKLATREYRAHEDAQAELTTLSEYVSQAVRGVRAQRASHGFGLWVKCLGASASRYADLRLKAQNLSIDCFPICSIPTIVSYIILLLWGPQLVNSKVLTVGEFAALASYVYLLQGPMAEIGELVSEWQRGFASVKRISEITNLPAELQTGEQKAKRISTDSNLPVVATQSVLSEDQSFAQSTILEVTGLKGLRQEKLVFENVDFRLAAGDWLGITGDVGCGKSSLLQSLSGLVPVAAGTIRLNGRYFSADLKKEVIASKKCEITYAPEKPFVFAGTIRHNLALSQKYSDEELWHALEVVCLADDVRRLPRMLDGAVGEGGVSLSGGQRQRLALARIVLRASGLVILDDPLSAVDGDTEFKIIRNLKRVWTSQSVIWASNKPSTLNCCHEIAKLTSSGLEFSQKSFDTSLPNLREAIHG